MTTLFVLGFITIWDVASNLCAWFCACGHIRVMLVNDYRYSNHCKAEFCLLFTAGVCGDAKLVGPSGSLSSAGYPNSYKNNQYCRSKIVVANSKKVALNIPSFKTESRNDVLELRDGKSGHLLYVLSGVLRAPLQITSPSNEMDVRFVTNGNVTLDGFTSNYFASGTNRCSLC